MKAKLLALCSLGFLLFNSGCAGTAGVSGLSVSGQVLTGGKIIDAGVNVGSNSVSVGGLFQEGTNSFAGQATIPTGK